MTVLRPQSLGDIPLGLEEHHREFLRKVKDAIEILTGDVQSQSDTSTSPNSKAVVFGDLTEEAAVISEESALVWSLLLR